MNEKPAARCNCIIGSFLQVTAVTSDWRDCPVHGKQEQFCAGCEIELSDKNGSLMDGTLRGTPHTCGKPSTPPPDGRERCPECQKCGRHKTYCRCAPTVPQAEHVPEPSTPKWKCDTCKRFYAEYFNWCPDCSEKGVKSGLVYEGDSIRKDISNPRVDIEKAIWHTDTDNLKSNPYELCECECGRVAKCDHRKCLCTCHTAAPTVPSDVRPQDEMERVIREIAKRVWNEQGWGDGNAEPECSEGSLCIAAVKAGYLAAIEQKASEL